MRKKYEKIIRFVEERPKVTLDAFLKKHPEIPSGTYHSTLNKLSQQGLLEKRSQSKRNAIYCKTNQFSIERAIDTVRKPNNQCKPYKLTRLEDVVAEAVRNIVDPATSLTFAQMEIRVNVKEKSPGFVEIDFAPTFCPMALELATYVKNAASQIDGIKETSVYCCGHVCKKQNSVSCTE